MVWVVSALGAPAAGPATIQTTLLRRHHATFLRVGTLFFPQSVGRLGKVGVWSIFRPTGFDVTVPTSTENMDLTPLSSVADRCFLDTDSGGDYDELPRVPVSGRTASEL